MHTLRYTHGHIPITYIHRTHELHFFGWRLQLFVCLLDTGLTLCIYIYIHIDKFSLLYIYIYLYYSRVTVSNSSQHSVTQLPQHILIVPTVLFKGRGYLRSWGSQEVGTEQKWRPRKNWRAYLWKKRRSFFVKSQRNRSTISKLRSGIPGKGLPYS